MKKVAIIIILIGCITACKTTYQTAGVNYLVGDAQTITLRCQGFASKQIDAIANAERNAVEEILFRGIPGHSQKDPLVSVTEAEAKKSHKKYFEELLENGRYKTFIISSIPTSEVQKVKGGKGQKYITVDVKINYRTLRSDLEQQGVIRKFGF